jgi:hypothetical protein
MFMLRVFHAISIILYSLSNGEFTHLFGVALISTFAKKICGASNICPGVNSTQQRQNDDIKAGKFTIKAFHRNLSGTMAFETTFVPG